MGDGDVLVTGANRLVIEKGQLVAARNSVSAMDANGNLLGHYDKAHLVPYGEYLPLPWLLRPLGLARLVPGDLDFWPGPGPQTMTVHLNGKPVKIGIQICYEMIFSGHVTDRTNRPDFIFNPSNDAWFGTIGPPQHLAQAQLRASQIQTSHHITFAGLSARYENGPWSLQGILARETFSQFPRYSGWGSSVVAGYRIGAWKPYLTWGRISFEPDDSPLALPAPAAALQTAYDIVVDRLTMNQRTFGAGVRYDFATDYALKVQIEKINASSSSILITPSGHPVRDASLTLFTVVLDFVF